MYLSRVNYSTAGDRKIRDSVRLQRYVDMTPMLAPTSSFISKPTPNDLAFGKYDPVRLTPRQRQHFFSYAAYS
jgi:hypothetical protein